MLRRFREIGIQATTQVDVYKEAVGVSRVHMYGVSCPYEIMIYSVHKHINTTRMHTIS